MNWLRHVFQRKKADELLEKELRFHIDQQAVDLIAEGMQESEALRQAKVAFGGAESAREGCRDARGTRWLEDLIQDIKYALRTLRRNPGFAAVAAATLALGIGATTIMFTVVTSILLKPLSYPDSDRLVALHERSHSFGETWGFAYPSYLDAKRESRSLDLAAWTYGGGTVSQPGTAEYASGRLISANVLPVLGVALVQGRSFLPEEDRPGAAPVALISQAMWERRFGGSPDAVGRQMVYEGKSYTIVGIVPAGFQLDGEADVFTPLGQSTEPHMQNRGARFIHVFGRIRPEMTPAEAQAEMDLITRERAERYREFNEGREIVAVALKRELVGEIRPTLWMLLGAVSLLLAIASVNVASLLLARAVSRERELAMRVALGASRGRLIRQCLTESGVLALFGGLLGVALAAVGVRPFVTLWPGSLPRAWEVQLDWRVLAFAVMVSLLSGLLFGLAPALRAPSRSLDRTLRAGGRTIAGSSRRLHASFVVSEVALAIVLLISAGMLARTLLRLWSVDPGFNAKNVLTAGVEISPAALTSPSQTRAAWDDFLDRARRTPGVQAAALADIVPMGPGENTLDYRTTQEEPPANQEQFALASCVTPDYLRVMGIPLREGRFLTEQDRLNSALVVVIDDNLARHAFGDARQAVGKQLWVSAMGSGPIQIVGVVGHVRHWGLAGDDLSRVHDEMYYPFAQVPGGLLHFFSSVMSVAVRTNVPPSEVVSSLREEVRGAAGDQVLYNVRTMEQLESNSLSRQRFLLVLFGIFAGLALLLSCIGIYGVLAYLTGQRVPEIGVRIALGASPGEVIALVIRQSLAMILAGIVIGAAASIAASRLMQRLVLGMQPTQISTFAVMISVLMAAALLASFLPARRASRIDPLLALRQD